jgi:VWFA-related protein
LRFLTAITFVLALTAGQNEKKLESERRLVDLSMVAVDHAGQPVGDLSKADITVTDDGKPQNIALFRRFDGVLRPSPTLGPGEFSNRTSGNVPYATVILFDLMNESFSNRVIAANRLVHDLESLTDAEHLYFYVLTIEGRLLAVRGLPEPGGGSTGLEGTRWTRQIKPLVDRTMKTVLHVRPAGIDVAVRVQLTFAALSSLEVGLSRVPGRKNIVWITDGVPISLGPHRSDTGAFVDFTEQWHLFSDQLARSGIAVYPSRQVMLGSTDGVDGSTRSWFECAFPCGGTQRGACGNGHSTPSAEGSTPPDSRYGDRSSPA